MGAQIILKECVLAALGSINHKRAHAGQSVIIKAFDHRGCAHRFMTQQNILDFNRRNPLARGLETVVTAAHVPPESILVLSVEIAGSHPIIDESLRRGFGSLPIPNRCAVTLTPKFSYYARRRGDTLMLEQARSV